MKKDTWLIAANGCKARIFKLEHKGALVEVETLIHPESRLHNHDLVSDRPGRDYESSNGRTRHAIEPATWPKDQEVILFAKTIAAYLDKARGENKFQKLYLAASPTLLGLLRHSLSPSTLKLISGEVDKDMTSMKPEQMIEHLPFIL